MSRESVGKAPRRIKKATSRLVWLGRAAGALVIGWLSLRVLEMLLDDDQVAVPADSTPAPAPSTPAAAPIPQPAPEFVQDDLTRVNGIGPGYAARLRSAGIRTFAQLADLGDEQLDAILQPRSFQRLDYDTWRAQAEKLAASPQPAASAHDLTRINGIGETYAARLRAAGIDTFARLAEQTPESLQATLHAPEWRMPDYESWLQQARELAA